MNLYRLKPQLYKETLKASTNCQKKNTYFQFTYKHLTQKKQIMLIVLPLILSSCQMIQTILQLGLGDYAKITELYCRPSLYMMQNQQIVTIMFLVNTMQMSIFLQRFNCSQYFQARNNNIKLQQIGILLNNKMKDHKNLIIDLGNKITRVWLNGNFMKFNSIIGFVNKTSVRVGDNDPDLRNFIDVISLIGRQIDENIVSNNLIYYPFRIQTNKNKKIKILMPTSNTPYHIEILLCILIKAIAQWVYKLVSEEVFLSISIVTSNSIPHPHRLIIYQICNTLFRNVNKIRIVKSTHLLISYYYFSQIKPQKMVMAVDCGDRYFSLGVYKLAPVNQEIVECMKFISNQNAGQHMTRLIIDYVLKKLKKQRGLDISTTQELMYSLIEQCQKAKIILSKMDQAFIQIKKLPDQTKYGVILTKDKFQQLILPILEHNLSLIQEYAKNYKISQIVISGGSFEIPLFMRLLQNVTKQNCILIQNIYNIKHLHCCEKISQQKLIFMDLCSSKFVIQPELSKEFKCIASNQRIPMRLVSQLKFPPGNLQFSMTIIENQRKVGHLLLQKPPHLNFTLIFTINESEIIHIQCVNTKGYLDLQLNLYGLQKKNIIQETLSQVDIYLKNII